MLGRRGVLDRTPIDAVAVNCAFADNFAYYGGAVAVAASGTFAAAASTFDGNAAAFGAAFALYEAAAEPVVTVRLDNDTRVRNNRASLCGGAAMVIQRLAGTVFDGGGAAFVDNGSDGDGGAFCVLGGAVHDGTIANVAISGSSAGAKGGAVFVNDDSGVSSRTRSAAVRNATFARCTRSDRGLTTTAGAIYGAVFDVFDAGDVSLRDVSVSEQRRPARRGAVVDLDNVVVADAQGTRAPPYLTDRTRVTLRGCTFEDNAATVHGGAAPLFGASKIVSRGANGFWGNDAGGRGGAFYLAEASEVKARHDAVAEAPAPSRAGRNSAARAATAGVQAYASFTTVGNATFVQSNKRVLGDAPSVSWSPSQGDQMAVIAEYGSPSVALRGELIVDDAGDAYDSTTTTLTADVVVALDPCFPGETLVEASQHCEPCAAGTYWRGASLGAWDAGGACHECPRGFYCEAEGLALGDLRVESGWHVASVDSRARLACAGCRLTCPGRSPPLFGGAFLAFLGALLWLLLSPRGEELLLLFFDTRGGAADDVTGMLHLDKNTPAPANEHDRKKQKFAALVVKAKALSSFFQLIASFQEAFGSGLQFPKTYASMQNAFSFATLGFFAYLPRAASTTRRRRPTTCAFTAVQTLVCDDFDAGDDGDAYFPRRADDLPRGLLWRAVIRPYGILMIFAEEELDSTFDTDLDMDKRQMLRLSSSFQRQCSTLRMEAFENDDPDGILAFKFLWIDYEPLLLVGARR
ncbi:alpha-ketoglutarate-dependent dioxygenase alkB-like protein [Aureococcus anophagefferens]|nr:alpha-ketoglutarate-dependent dioxygenase alkB-like protein [Aureococcus anophagefferens]